MSAARYESWRDVIAEFVPRIRAAERGIGDRGRVQEDLLDAAEAFGAPFEWMLQIGMLAFMMDNPDGDRFIFEQTGARVGTMREAMQ